MADLSEPGCLEKPVGKLNFNLKYLLLELILRCILGGAIGGLLRITPFKRSVYGVDWYNHYYPYTTDQAFPELEATIVYASCIILIPVIVLIVCITWKKMPGLLVYEEVINFVLGISLALCLNFIFTELIKNTYSRPRPDYLERCLGPDRSKWPAMLSMPAIPTCTSGLSDKLLLDGRKSFPSAHTSLGFATYVYLGLFVYRKLSQIKNSGSLRLIIPSIFVAFALFVGITRTQDYRHFPSDVAAGAILGSFMAWICWRFYDQIAEQTYKKYRKKEGMHGQCKDPFYLNTPPQFVHTKFNQSFCNIGNDEQDEIRHSRITIGV